MADIQVFRSRVRKLEDARQEINETTTSCQGKVAYGFVLKRLFKRLQITSESGESLYAPAGIIPHRILVMRGDDGVYKDMRSGVIHGHLQKLKELLVGPNLPRYTCISERTKMMQKREEQLLRYIHNYDVAMHSLTGYHFTAEEVNVVITDMIDNCVLRFRSDDKVVSMNIKLDDISDPANIGGIIYFESSVLDADNVTDDELITMVDNTKKWEQAFNVQFNDALPFTGKRNRYRNDKEHVIFTWLSLENED